MTDVGPRTVFVGNLAWSVNWKDLKDLMREAGEVEHVEVLEYRDGRKTGAGIVRFVEDAGAKKAIADFNDRDLKGRQIFVREDKEGGTGPGSKGKGKLSEEEAGRQVYVGNLSWQTSWQDLKDFMKTCGEVEFCDIIQGKDGFRSAGAGLVRYKNKEDAEKAIATLTDTELGGRSVFVREDREGKAIKGASSKGKGKGKGKKGKGKKGGREYSLGVEGLPDDCDWKQLKDAFKAHYPTHTIVDGSSGTVKFGSEKDANAAYESVDKVGEKKVKITWEG